MQAWHTKSKRVILDYSKFLKVEQHEVVLPDGQVIPDWPWVIAPDYVNVAAVTADGQFLAFKQTKYSVEGVTLAPVGGYLEPGEDPLEAGKRELLEETGYQADTWQSLGMYASDGNRGVGRAHLYLATNAVRVTEPDADDLEEQQMLLLSPDDVMTALNNNEFKVLAWATIMSMALLKLRE